MKTYTYQGCTLTAKQWAAKLGISTDAFYQRVDDIADLDKVFSPQYIRKPTRKNQFHGKSRSNTYNCWVGMIRRCTNPDSKKWHRYGGRGIKVAKRWMIFENFLADMGERPYGTSLDRINNNGNYSKHNCRWATSKEQALNTSVNVKFVVGGKLLTTEEAAQAYGISRGALKQRLSRQRSGKYDYGLETVP